MIIQKSPPGYSIRSPASIESKPPCAPKAPAPSNDNAPVGSKLGKHYDRVGRLITYLSNQRLITPKSPLGQALAYAVQQWPHLEPCFHDGQIEWDNNLTENTIRPTKLGHGRWVDKAFDIPSLPARLLSQGFIETIPI